VDVTLVVDSLAPPLTGIGRYTWELSQRIPQQPGIGDVGFFTNGAFLEDPADFANGRRWPGRRIPGFLRPRLVKNRLSSTLVHGPNYFVPREAETGIITVHDLSIFRHPETHPADRRQVFEREFESSLRRACHVIADTHTVRREIVENFSLPEDRVSVVHLGVDRRFRPRTAAELRPELTPFGLNPGSYALCVSTLEPRKKIAELIRAWSRLPGVQRTATPLVLAGAEGWLNEELHREIREGVSGGWLRHIGFVDEDSLPALYAGATLFLFPSIYEGFGLPPVEAMASGTPTLVADRSCLPEVCGRAAAYVDPDDGDGFTAAIAKALLDRTWQQEVIRQGLSQAARYTWERCAAETAEIYQRCASASAI
jgi:alpha-1,3-rhamnosyl/mannosyltransferase